MLNTFLPTISYGLRYDSASENLLNVSYGIQVCSPTVSGVPLPVPDFLPSQDITEALTGEPSRIFGIFPEILTTGTVLWLNSCEVSSSYELTSDYYLCLVKDVSFLELSDGRVLLKDVKARYLTIDALEILGYSLVPETGFPPVERDEYSLLYVSDNLYPYPVQYQSPVSDESDGFQQGANLTWPYSSLVGFTSQEENLIIWSWDRMTVSVPYSNYAAWRQIHNDFTPIYTYKGLLENIGYSCLVLNVQGIRTLYVENAGYFQPSQVVDLPGLNDVIAFRAKNPLTNSRGFGTILASMALLTGMGFHFSTRED